MLSLVYPNLHKPLRRKPFMSLTALARACSGGKRTIGSEEREQKESAKITYSYQCHKVNYPWVTHAHVPEAALLSPNTQQSARSMWEFVGHLQDKQLGPMGSERKAGISKRSLCLKSWPHQPDRWKDKTVTVTKDRWASDRVRWGRHEEVWRTRWEAINSSWGAGTGWGGGLAGTT